MRLIFPLTGALLLISCAQEGAPPGGPPDTFPPHVVHLAPANRSTLVPTNVSPVMTFNERVDSRSLEEGLLVVPLISFKFESNWSGNEITIRFDEPLRDAQTYIITLGTSLRDMRGNRMAASTVYAFSTGPVIDQGEISGTAATGMQNASGAYVWAYNVRANPAPNPAHTLPDYVAQTGTDGTFSFSNLSKGVYRIFAFQDRGRDLRYDEGLDALGLPPKDIALTDSLWRGGPIRLELAVRDTTGLRIQSIRAVHTGLALVKLSAPLDEGSVNRVEGYRIHSRDGADTLDLIAAYRDPVDSTSIAIVTAPQKPSTAYMLRLPPVKDRKGRTLVDHEAAGEFVSSSLTDASPPSLKQTDPPGGARQIPLNPTFRFVFNEAVHTTPDAIRLFAAGDSVASITALWVSPAVAAAHPDAPLLPDTAYRIALIASRIRDLAGHPLDTGKDKPDTLWSTFYTVDPAEYGTISGVVTDRDALARGPVAITLTNTLKQSYDVRIETPGPYRAANLLPGKYMVHAYRDANGNGIFDAGAVMPFVPAERAVMRPDSVLVRSGWESEHVDIYIVP